MKISEKELEATRSVKLWLMMLSIKRRDIMTKEVECVFSLIGKQPYLTDITLEIMQFIGEENQETAKTQG